VKKAVLILLIFSLAANVWLWKRVAGQQHELAARASAAEDLRKQVQELAQMVNATARTQPPSAEVSELARLRNEVGQLRSQLSSAPKPASPPTSWRRVPATADWSEKFAAATNELAESSKYIEELSSNHDLLISNLAAASPQALDDLKRRAQSRQCISNLKRIGLAARVWANENGDRFPPDYFTMREELATPAVLFCPAAPTAHPNDWSQLNPATVTYTWHGATADERRPESTLATCPIHGHFGIADGSVQMAPGHIPDL
jgi:hypothetical protein